MRGSILSLLFAGLLWPQFALAALPEGLAGAWHGVVEIDGAEAPVRVTLTEQARGFAFALAFPASPPLRADFVPSEQPRVFEVATARRGLFGFFADDDGSTPFDGAPLIWARESGLGIVAYRLEVAADGGMALLRTALTPVEGGVEMHIERRIDARSPLRFVILLEPAG